MTKETILQAIRGNKDYLAKKYHVKKIALFGSHVSGMSKRNSDVDILVEFSRPIGMFAFMDLEDSLRHLLKVRKVDLVSKKALKPYIGKRVLKEAIYA